jgi:hypothetical protein
MFLLIIVINNIFKFNTLNLILWLFFTYAKKDHEVYTFIHQLSRFLTKKKLLIINFTIRIIFVITNLFHYF